MAAHVCLLIYGVHNLVHPSFVYFSSVAATIKNLIKINKCFKKTLHQVKDLIRFEVMFADT